MDDFSWYDEEKGGIDDDSTTTTHHLTFPCRNKSLLVLGIAAMEVLWVDI